MAYDSMYSNGSSVNTDGFRLFGPSATMSMDFWNTYVTARISPIKSEADRAEGGTMYDYRDRISITLNKEDCIHLGTKMKDEFIKASLQGTPWKAGIKSAKTNLFLVSNGIKETGELSPYVAIFRDLNQQRIAKQYKIFQFRPRSIITEYDQNSGDFAEVEEKLGDVYPFIVFLISTSIAYGQTVHADRWIRRLEHEENERFRAALGGKLGINYQQPINYSNNYNNKIDPWNNSKTTNDSTNSATVSTASSIDDIDNLF